MVVVCFSRLCQCQRQHISWRTAIWLQHCLYLTAPKCLLLLQSFLSILHGWAVATASAASSADRINCWLLPCCKLGLRKLWHEKVHPRMLRSSSAREGPALERLLVLLILASYCFESLKWAEHKYLWDLSGWMCLSLTDTWQFKHLPVCVMWSMCWTWDICAVRTFFSV